MVLPLVWALVRSSPVAAHTTAMGAWLSFYFLYVPPGPQGLPVAAGASALVLATTIGASLLLDDLRSRGGRLARLPWLSGVAAVVTAAALGSLFLVSESATTDWGGGPERAGHSVHAMGRGHGAGTPAMRSVDELTGPRDGTPDARFTLTAAHGTVRLSSGKKIDALTFNGISPGPELRVGKGQLVEVTLVNKDVVEGVTLHWHGVDVPNAEDGVPGVTQNPVRPGERHVYRFVPDRTGTYNGEAVTGSTWWTDTLNVAPGESYEIDFSADNPGVWMDHCHNFEHAESGMIMHLAYDDVTTPYHGPAH
ncbi:multicopper oxidase domain-containing protein [Streptomyces sp. NBC_00390]|uniref:multicopper oxidase domain-containing protein n=1 Tax=Streptomyces sp. NBC_00390 TaxID=2975736 RepID=UPI002E22796F